MQIRRPGLPIAMLAILFLAAAVWIPLRHSAFPVQEVTLTNGPTFRLVSVQVGTRHFDPIAPVWQRLAHRLPPSLSRRLGWQQPTWNPVTTNETLSVWITASQAPSGTGAPTYGIEVGDDEGNFASDTSGIQLPRGPGPGVAHYEGHRLNIFPRRSPELRIRIRQSPWGHASLIHEFRIRNPRVLTTRMAPPLVGRPVPQVSTNGDLEATLVDFRLRTGHMPTEDRTAELEFTLRQSGNPSTNWVAYHVNEVADATGNTGDGNSWRHGWHSNRTFVAFSRWPLPPSEPWRLRVEFCRQGFTAFATNELLHFPSLPIADKPDTYTQRTGSILGTSIVVQDVAKRDERYFAPTGTRAIRLKVGTGSPPPDSQRWHLTLARVIDSTGRDVTANAWSGSDGEREFSLQVSTNATSLDVWIGYVPSRRIEFIAQPRPVKGSEGALP